MQQKVADWILKLARPEICAMTPYSSARREQSQGKIWLNANENPSPIMKDELWNRYPDPQPMQLIEVLAELYHVTPEHILAGRGSDEMIDLLMRLFCIAGKDSIIICPPTYGMYKIAAQIQHASIVEIPLLKDQDFALDVQGILERWQPINKLIFLCSPNNPTGNLLEEDAILSLCEQLQEKAIVIVDEAYIEFSSHDSMSKYINQYTNLVVVRTLSKAYALAGVRCGAVLANPAIIELLQKIIAPYPIPSPIAKIILQQLTPVGIEKLGDQIKNLQQQREFLNKSLAALPIVEKIWESEANFLLIEVKDAARVMQHCQNKGIIIRDRSKEYGLNNCVRITVGNPDENKFLLETLADV